MSTITVPIDTSNIDDYHKFLKIRTLPQYTFRGSFAQFPERYAAMILDDAPKAKRVVKWKAPEWFFDYQADITALAIKRRKFAVFADCGLGKTPIILAFALEALKDTAKPILLVSPLMVCKQTIAEARRWWGDKYPIEHVRAAELPAWLAADKPCIGITNYEAITDGLDAHKLGGLLLDESSMLKSHYGAWGTRLIEMGKGIEWKLCATGTPAPNDRIEYANHAVFLDHVPTVNSFLARYFVNRGETSERWELKHHALAAFYRSLSDWSIFLNDPSVYGWKGNGKSAPPIHVHVHEVALTPEQTEAIIGDTGMLLPTNPGGITRRTRLAQIAKGSIDGKRISTNKPDAIKALVDSWPDESTIIWCIYNNEQDRMAELFPDAANITGATSDDERERLISEFQAGKRRVLITKAKILGFGLNLQVATRHVFSGLQDSYENFYQAIKRSNRIGSTRPLNVHIPITEVEKPLIETVMDKRDRVLADSAEQERLFKEHFNVDTFQR